MSIFGVKTIPSRQKTGLTFIFVGLFCFAIVVAISFYQQYRQKILSFDTAPQLVENDSEFLYPAWISVARLKIELPVSPATIKAGIWEISPTGASYLVGSGIPGEKGNVVIYGHNKKYLFGPILSLKKGDQIRIKNTKSDEYEYLVEEIKTVTPQEVEILLPGNGASLTLYTCSGLFDSKRFVALARLKGEKE